MEVNNMAYDSTQALAQIETMRSNLASQIAGIQADDDALAVADSIIVQGIQIDQTRLDADTAAGIAAGIQAAVSDATAPLNDQIKTLTDAASGEADRIAAAVEAATAPIQATIDGEPERTARAVSDALAAATPVAVPVVDSPTPDPSTAQPTDTSTPSDTIQV